jgi:hypothetical protein
MAVTIDVTTESLRIDTSNPMTWSHAGGTGPKGVLIGIIHGTSSTDHVTSVSYGTRVLTRIQRNTDTATESGAAEWWFVGSSIPAGTQTVTVNLATATTDDIHGISITLNATADLAILSKGGVSENAANPSVALTYWSRSGMAFAAFYSGLGTQASITAGTNCTKFATAGLSGSFISCCIRQTTGGTADFTVAATSATDDVAFAAVAIGEIPSVPALVRTRPYAPTPSYARNFARNARQSVVPEQWEGLVAAYAPFLGIQGLSVEDQTGFGADGTLTGTDSTSWVVRAPGLGINLDVAGTKYLQSTTKSIAEPMTMMMWCTIPLVSGGVYGSLLMVHGQPPTTATDAHRIYADTGPGTATALSRSAVPSSGSAASANGLIAPDVPFHVAAVFTSATSRTIYVNGGNAVTNTTSITVAAGNTMRWCLRQDAGESGLAIIFEARIYERALTADEVMAIAQDPTALYRLRRKRFSKPPTLVGRTSRNTHSFPLGVNLGMGIGMEGGGD